MLQHSKTANTNVYPRQTVNYKRNQEITLENINCLLYPMVFYLHIPPTLVEVQLLCTNHRDNNNNNNILSTEEVCN